MGKNLVIIPTYNEAENVIRMIESVFSIHGKKFDILIVDDSSPDGTADLVKKLIIKYQSQLYLLERDKKIGLGAAYISGFNWGLENKYDYFFQMDCDFSHDPNDLKRLHNVIFNNEADMVVGSRYVSGVNVVNWPMSRVLLSYFASKYVRFFIVLAPGSGFSARPEKRLLLLRPAAPPPPPSSNPKRSKY